MVVNYLKTYKLFVLKVYFSHHILVTSVQQMCIVQTGSYLQMVLYFIQCLYNDIRLLYYEYKYIILHAVDIICELVEPKKDVYRGYQIRKHIIKRENLGIIHIYCFFLL